MNGFIDKHKMESAFVHDHTAHHEAGKITSIAGHQQPPPGFVRTGMLLYSEGGIRRFFKGLLLNWIKVIDKLHVRVGGGEQARHMRVRSVGAAAACAALRVVRR